MQESDTGVVDFGKPHPQRFASVYVSKTCPVCLRQLRELDTLPPEFQVRCVPVWVARDGVPVIPQGLTEALTAVPTTVLYAANAPGKERVLQVLRVHKGLATPQNLAQWLCE